MEDMSEIRSVFTDRAQCIALLDNCLKSFIPKEGTAELEAAATNILIQGSKMVHERNIGIVFDNAESEIEKMFLSGLVIGFALADPFNLVVHPPTSNIQEQIEEVRDDYLCALGMWQEFCGEFGGQDIDVFSRCLRNAATAGAIDTGWAEWVISYITLRSFWDDLTSIHMTIQAGFKDVRVDGKKIRTDIALWNPNSEQLRMVVECDGYDYHSSKESFASDRIRDRELKKHGWTVLRYSGSEIFRNPVAVGADLVSHLRKYKRKALGDYRVPAKDVARLKQKRAAR